MNGLHDRINSYKLKFMAAKKRRYLAIFKLLNQKIVDKKIDESLEGFASTIEYIFYE